MQPKQSFTLLPGESMVDYAPHVQLPNGQSCVPQHYLKYAHRLETVEAILQDVCFDERYPIFVAQEAEQLCLQVGVIGPDNYDHQGAHKIVYGRKWRIEPDLPTSEIIQTAFLALQKAREHEIRERLNMHHDGRTTTPFNNHHDLPLMAEHRDFFIQEAAPSTEIMTFELLNQLRYDNARFSVQANIALTEHRRYLNLVLEPRAGSILEEVKNGLTIDLLLESNTTNHLLHRLIEQLVLASNRYVAQTFTYKGFARFSEQVCVQAIAEVSSSTRSVTLNSLTENSHANMQYAVDENRRPVLPASAYAKQLNDVIQRFEPLQGFKPIFGF